MKKIFYLGPKGSYSYTITKNLFSEKDNEFVGCSSFDDVVKNVLAGPENLGILPIENSITSSVHETMDYLFNDNLTIIAESYLKITLHLIGLKDSKLETIKKVYSHPKALAQAKKYISEKQFNTVETSSTSAAKEQLIKSQDKTSAIIGGKDLLENSDLIILDKNIAGTVYNVTRFVIIALNENKRISGRKNKLSVMFMLPHKPGSLAAILTEFANANFNLTKVESRPVPGTSWEYQFWVDIMDEEGNFNEEKISYILSNFAQSFKIIGTYESGETFES